VSGAKLRLGGCGVGLGRFSAAQHTICCAGSLNQPSTVNNTLAHIYFLPSCFFAFLPACLPAGALGLLEERWHLLGTLCPTINSSWGENEVLTSDMLVGTLFGLGTRVRRLPPVN
jgi:hypothetical protein